MFRKLTKKKRAQLKLSSKGVVRRYKDKNGKTRVSWIDYLYSHEKMQLEVFINSS